MRIHGGKVHKSVELQNCLLEPPKRVLNDVTELNLTELTWFSL